MAQGAGQRPGGLGLVSMGTAGARCGVRPGKSQEGRACTQQESDGGRSAPVSARGRAWPLESRLESEPQKGQQGLHAGGRLGHGG